MSLVTAAQVSELRRKIAEPTTATYSDALLKTYIEKYPHLDEQGAEPYTLSSSTPPTQEVNENWIPTYDLNAAAADVWEEKAAPWSDKYDFSADGGNYSRSQVYDKMVERCRYYRARRLPSTARAHKWPKEKKNRDTLWIGNLPEPD